MAGCPTLDLAIQSLNPHPGSSSLSIFTNGQNGEFSQIYLSGNCVLHFYIFEEMSLFKIPTAIVFHGHLKKRLLSSC